MRCWHKAWMRARQSVSPLSSPRSGRYTTACRYTTKNESKNTKRWHFQGSQVGTVWDSRILETVSEQFAREAGLSKTCADGVQHRKRKHAWADREECFCHPGTVQCFWWGVAVGFVEHEVGDALPGQSFLLKFKIVPQKDQMTLRKRWVQN